MLNENIRMLRKQKGMSQEELAEELHVVRQTISKWEKGLSVPDAGILIKIAEALETTVDVLLGEKVPEPEDKNEIRIIAEKLEAINTQLAAQARRRRIIWRVIWICVAFAGMLILAKNAIIWVHGIHAESTLQYSTGIIGGADGPTSILVAARVSTGKQVLTALILMIISATGIYLTRRK